MEFPFLIKGKMVIKSLASKLSDVVFIFLIDVKRSTFVGILTFVSRIIFMLSYVEHN